MIILALILVHWYFSLFFQTFFHHRYSAHEQFTMTKGWEKVFYFASWLFQGFTAISPNTYGKFHRMHHAYADTEKDVHSPKHDGNLIAMMMKTDKLFRAINKGEMELEDRFNHNLPMWNFMEKYGYSWPVRIGWVAVYISLYYAFVPENAQWMWALLPLHCLMTPLQGAIINWYGHVVGYVNHKVSNTSRNLMPFDIFMMGEGYHNNHHAQPNSPNFAQKWYEIDPVYPFIRLFDFLGIIKLKPKVAERAPVSVS